MGYLLPVPKAFLLRMQTGHPLVGWTLHGSGSNLEGVLTRP